MNELATALDEKPSLFVGSMKKAVSCGFLGALQFHVISMYFKKGIYYAKEDPLSVKPKWAPKK